MDPTIRKKMIDFARPPGPEPAETLACSESLFSRTSGFWTVLTSFILVLPPDPFALSVHCNVHRRVAGSSSGDAHAPEFDNGALGVAGSQMSNIGMSHERCHM